MNSAHIRRVVAAGTIGNVLEWYDFAIYGYFAAQIGRHFFPHDDAVAQLLAAFGVFAIGYLMRPIGGDTANHDHEYDEVRWFPVSEAKRRLTFSDEVEILDKAVTLIEQRPEGEHDDR